LVNARLTERTNSQAAAHRVGRFLPTSDSSVGAKPGAAHGSVSRGQDVPTWINQRELKGAFHTGVRARKCQRISIVKCTDRSSMNIPRQWAIFG